MNDWGIPDWRDANAYGEVKHWGHMRWRWEFYRRRDDLRHYFDANAESTYQEHLAFYSSPEDMRICGPVRVLKPNEPGFTANVDIETARNFGYAGVPNPRISDQTSSAMFSSLDYPNDVKFTKGSGERWPNGDSIPETLADGEIKAVFNIDKPLAPQIEAAKNMLEFYQKSRHGSKLQKRQRRELWLTYLRVIDARADGATWAEISEILPEHMAKPHASRCKAGSRARSRVDV